VYFGYHSCNHRSCPKCGGADAQAWLDGQCERVLPVPYFLITFTLPEQRRAPCRPPLPDVKPLCFPLHGLNLPGSRLHPHANQLPACSYSFFPLQDSLQIADRTNVPQLIRVDDRAHGLDLSGRYVERPHADQFPSAVEEKGARLTVHLDLMPPPLH
jgi:Transposase zinc-binding domain